jgi:hypothetical protein
MSNYNKSIATDFGGNFNIDTFKSDIYDSSITATLTALGSHGDNVFVGFTPALSGAEETTLNSLISTHNGASDISYSQTHTAYAKKDFYKDTSYKDISTYMYDGSDKLGPIKEIVCVAYKDSSVTDFSIRIYDDTNNNIIAENTFSNSSRVFLTLTPLTNIPMKKAIITVQIKKTGGNNKQYVHIENIQFRI